MRRIQTAEEKEKKKRNTQIIVGVVLIGLMVLSTVGYAFVREDDSGGNSKVSYNGFEFVRVNNQYWGLSVEGQDFYFQNLPSETSNVSISGTYILGDYVDEPLYFVNLDTGNSAAQEILNDVGRYVLRYQEACIEGFDCTAKDFPIKNCNESNVIVFEQPLESFGETDTIVRKEGNCVYITGDLIIGSDAFLYRLLGIA